MNEFSTSKDENNVTEDFHRKNGNLKLIIGILVGLLLAIGLFFAYNEYHKNQLQEQVKEVLGVAEKAYNEESEKAIASEFPMFLTAIYTCQIAYQAEKDSYSTDISYVMNCVDGLNSKSTQNSEYFSYSLDNLTKTTFTAHAVVKNPFGKAKVGDEATINQNNEKSCSPSLLGYYPNWK